MPTFQSNPFSNFYKRILQINQSSNTGVDATTRNVESGDGAKTAMNLSDDELAIQPQNDDGTRTFRVSNASGDELFSVDSTNSLVKANTINVTTQYAYFGITNTDNQSVSANNHYAIPFSKNSITTPLSIGTGTTPDTTYTITNSADLFSILSKKALYSGRCSIFSITSKDFNINS